MITISQACSDIGFPNEHANAILITQLTTKSEPTRRIFASKRMLTIAKTH